MNNGLESLFLDLSNDNSLIKGTNTNNNPDEYHNIFDDAHTIGCILYYALTENKNMDDCDPRLVKYIEFIQHLYAQSNHNEDFDSIRTLPSRVEAVTTMQCLV